MEDFKLFHKHARLARRGAFAPLSCSTCGTAYVTRLGEDDEVLLQCFLCGSMTRPGEGMLRKMREDIEGYERGRTV